MLKVNTVGRQPGFSGLEDSPAPYNSTGGDPQKIRNSLFNGVIRGVDLSTLDARAGAAQSVRQLAGEIVSYLRASPSLALVLTVSLGAYAISHGAAALTLGWLGRAIVQKGAEPDDAQTFGLVRLCFLGLAATFVKAISAVYLAYSEAKIAGGLGAKLRSRLIRILLHHGTHDAAPRVLATFAVRLREVEAGTRAALSGAKSAAQLVPLAIALIFVSPFLLLGAGAVLVPFGVGLSRLRSTWRRANERAQALAEELHEGQDDLVRNLDLWRAYGAGARAKALVESSALQAAAAGARVDAGRAALSGFNEVLGAMALLGAVALATQAGAALGDGTLVAFVAILLMTYRPLRDLGDARAMSSRTAVAMDALERLTLPFEPLQPEPTGSAMSSVGSWPFERTECVGFGCQRFGVRKSFAIEPGEFVCLMGATGSGKTTLLRTLLGLEPAEGILKYAGKDVTRAAVGPDTRPFAWVPQEATLVTATLLDNVALFSGDKSEAVRMLELLGARSLLDAVGSDLIGPGGRPLSGGERRLVALARALCTELPVLLLDEPTEGLDPDAARVVVDALDRVAGQRTLLVVTHREELAARAHRIIRMND